MKTPEMMSVLRLLLCWSGMLVAAESDECAYGSKETYYTCPTDCSQLEKRVDGDNSIFNCTIGGIESIKKFKLYHPSVFRPDTEKIFAAPTLQDISFFKKKMNNRDNPSLKINFLLPTGMKLKNKDKPVYPKAVLLKFEGIADPDYQDKFYSRCPRQRIFRFHHYNPLTTYDLYNPRNLTFDCLVGLSDDDDKLSNYPNVYKITLETVEGRSVVYTVTVNVFVSESEWNTVIATQYDEQRKSIYVVFQKFERDGDHVLGYLVSLQRVGKYDPVLRKLPARNNTVLFTDVEPGQYYVNDVGQIKGVRNGETVFKPSDEFPWQCSCNFCVSVMSTACRKSTFCMNTTSYPIGSQVPADNDPKIVVVVLGCAIGLILILLLAFIFIKQKQDRHKVCGWLVHPFEEDADKFDVIKKFTEYIEDTCNCSVRTFKPKDWTEATAENDLKKWCENTLSKYAKFVIIALDTDAFDPNDACSLRQFYSYSIKAAVERKKLHNNIRIFSVCFPFTGKCTLPEVLGDNSPHYHMMKESAAICENICNFSELPPANQPLIHDESEKRNAVLEAISKVPGRCRPQPNLPKTHAKSLDQDPNCLPEKLASEKHTVEIKQTSPQVKPAGKCELLKELYSINKDDICFEKPVSLQNGDLKDSQTSDSNTVSAEFVDGYVQDTDLKQLEKNSEDQRIKSSTTGNVTGEYVSHDDVTGEQVISSYVTGDCAEGHSVINKPEGNAINGYVTGDYAEGHSVINKPKGNAITGYVTCDYAEGHSVINKPQSPQDRRNQVKFDLDIDTCGTSMPKSMPDIKKHNLSESDNNHVEHVEMTNLGRGGKGEQYVTTDPVLHLGNAEQETQHRDYSEATGNRPEHLIHVPENHRQESRQQHGCHNHTEIAGANYGPGSHASYAVHPSWKSRQGFNDAQFLVKSGNQPLHSMDRLGDMYNRQFYAGDQGQYVLAQGQHPNTMYGHQHIHQRPWDGGKNCQNSIMTDDRQCLANQNYVRYNEFDPGFYCESAARKFCQNEGSRRHQGLHDQPIHDANIPYQEMPIAYTDYNRPQYHRFNSYNSDRSDSVLSADGNLEYETSYEKDPHSYITSDEMNRFESDRHSSGYSSSSLERPKPIGSSGSSIAVTSQPRQDAKPTALKSQNSCPADFLHAVNVESALRKEYEMFEPIPPEDDQSPTGSIPDIMEQMEQLNTSIR